jgi:hypothetical protein
MPRTLQCIQIAIRLKTTSSALSVAIAKMYNLSRT